VRFHALPGRRGAYVLAYPLGQGICQSLTNLNEPTSEVQRLEGAFTPTWGR
jgi:hypothetical protein